MLGKRMTSGENDAAESSEGGMGGSGRGWGGVDMMIRLGEVRMTVWLRKNEFGGVECAGWE